MSVKSVSGTMFLSKTVTPAKRVVSLKADVKSTRQPAPSIQVFCQRGLACPRKAADEDESGHADHKIYMAAIQHVFHEDRPREQPHLTAWLNHRNTALVPLLKPRRLRPGDTVAAISLSWGGPGAYPHRYQIGKKQFADEFGVQVVETRHALRDPTWLARNPKARADDLMEAFADRSIAGIVSTIGGNDSIRLLPHLSLDVIQANPKVFLGYSDTTVSHFTCLRAGLTSFYGPAFMAGFAENGGMFPFMATSVRKTIFTSDAIGVIEPNQDGWTVEHLAWSVPEHQHQRRKLTKPTGWKFLQGSGSAQGRLIGGCFESLQSLRATPVWPDASWFDGAILFLETSEEGVPPRNVTRELRIRLDGDIEKTIRSSFRPPRRDDSS